MTDNENHHHAMKAPRRIILPPFWMIFALGSQWALHRWLPLWQVSAPALNVAGALVAALGLVLIGVSLFGFKRARTGIVPFTEATALVSGGFYRFSRNPMYLGMAFILVGFALKAGSASTLLPIPLFMWIIQRRYILPEEAFLEAALGDEYRAFKSRVRRWL